MCCLKVSFLSKIPPRNLNSLTTGIDAPYNFRSGSAFAERSCEKCMHTVFDCENWNPFSSAQFWIPLRQRCIWRSIAIRHVVDQLRDMYNRQLMSTNIDHDLIDHCVLDVNEGETGNSECCNVAVTRNSRYNLRSSNVNETDGGPRVVPEGVSSVMECDQAIDTKDDNVLFL